MSTQQVFINGQYMPADNATISLSNRGFLYGDGVFETMKAYYGVVLALDKHMARLKNGAEALEIPFEQIEESKNAIKKLLRVNGLEDQEAYVKVIITRGDDPGSLLPAPDSQTSLIIIAKPLDRNIISKTKREGVSTSLFNGRMPSIPYLKTLNLLPNILARMASRKEGAYEGLWNDGSLILEGTTSNFFVVTEDIIKTHPLDGRILPGITRGLVIELAKQANLFCLESTIALEEILSCKEAFITNSIIEIVPVIRIASKKIGNGKPGKITAQLQRQYERFVSKLSNHIIAS